MKIYTSYFGNVRRLTNDRIVCISIARITPNWFTGYKFTYLAPSRALLYNREITDEEFERVYLRDVCSRIDAQVLRREIERVSQGRDVALLCYEKPGDECHRHTLARWMNERGFDVKEYGHQNAVKQEEKVNEPSLFDGW